jgi:hypothetical protein
LTVLEPERRAGLHLRDSHGQAQAQPTREADRRSSGHYSAATAERLRRGAAVERWYFDGLAGAVEGAALAPSNIIASIRATETRFSRPTTMKGISPRLAAS